MLKTVYKTAMGMVIGFAIQTQAQSYLSQKPLKFQRVLPSTASANLTGSTSTNASRLALPQSTAQIQNRAVVEMNTDEAPEKTFELSVLMGVKSLRVQDENIKATTSASKFGVDFKWNLTNWLNMDLEADANFVSGQSVAIYGREGGPSSNLKISEGSFTVKPFKSFKISSGLVKTQFNPNSSAFRKDDGFSGFRENLEYTNGIFHTSLIGYQVVPSQTGTSNRIIDGEKDSSLIITNFNIGLVNGEEILQLSYSKYDFYNMTSALASDSRYLGNTMIGDGSGEFVYYKYQFRGQEVALKAQTLLRLDDRVGFEGSFTQNDKAPKKRNQGWKSASYYQYNFGKYAIEPKVLRFRYEPDVIPAPYASGNLGYMNRDGYAAELRGHLKKYKVEAYLQYVDGKEVEPQLTQSDRTSYMFGLEVKYEIL